MTERRRQSGLTRREATRQLVAWGGVLGSPFGAQAVTAILSGQSAPTSHAGGAAQGQTVAPADAWPQFGATPTPTPTATVIDQEGQQAPAVTKPQAERILSRIAATVAEADESKDKDLAATRLDGATLSFDLPAGVAWTGRASVTAGDDLVLAGDRLVWRLGTIAAHASVLHEAPSVSFEVALTPTAAQAGTSPALLSSAAFTATDAWTGADLAETAAGLTTALPGDPKVAGRTVVRP